jgi:hypothetical protein
VFTFDSDGHRALPMADGGDLSTEDICALLNAETRRAAGPPAGPPGRLREPLTTMSCWGWLSRDLKLIIFEQIPIGRRLDRAAIALAVPDVGLVACRTIDSYKSDKLLPLAFHLTMGGVLDETLMRHYATRADATWAGCKWLTEVAVERRAKVWFIKNEPPRGARGPRNVAYFIYSMCSPRICGAALVRVACTDGKVQHFEGEKGAERLVREVLPDGCVKHYEGEKGAERLVREVLPDGCVKHYEGEKDAERLVA